MKKNVNNFRIWYEYDILGWPPILLSKKYNISAGRVCTLARNKRALYEDAPVPDKWLCERRWDRVKDGIE